MHILILKFKQYKGINVANKQYFEGWRVSAYGGPLILNFIFRVRGDVWT